MANLAEKTFTLALTSSNGESGGGSLTFLAEYGFKKVAILGTSSTACTVTGTARFGSLESGQISLTTGQSLTIIANDNCLLDGIVINCPSGATCNVVAQG